MSRYDHDFEEFKELAKRVTEDLKKMNEMQKDMRWQFGDPEWFYEFEREMDITSSGWMSSHC